MTNPLPPSPRTEGAAAPDVDPHMLHMLLGVLEHRRVIVTNAIRVLRALVTTQATGDVAQAAAMSLLASENHD